MTSNTKAYRGLLLSALMVVSVFAGSIAFAGGAAAVVDDGELDFPNQIESSDNVTVDLVSSNDVDNSSVVVTYEDSNGDTIVAGANSSINSEGDVVVNLTGSATTYNEEFTAWLFNTSDVSTVNQGDTVTTSIADAAVASASGIVVASEAGDADFEEAYDVDAAYAATDLDAQIAWQGQEIAVYDLNTSEELVLRSGDAEDSSPESQLSTDGAGVTTFGTENLDADSYFLDGAGAAGDSQIFDVVIQDLTAEFDSDSVENDDETSVDLEFDSNRANYNVIVTSENLDYTELQDIFVNNGDFTEDSANSDADADELALSNVDGVTAADFSDIDTGEYEFTFAVTDTSAEDNDSITVEEPAAGQVNLVTGTPTVAQGDVAEITLEFSETETGMLVIGNEEDVGYQANVSVDSDGEEEVTLAFNTYSAGDATGTSEGELVWVADDDSDATIEVNTAGSVSSILETGDYDLYTGTEGNTSDASETIDLSDDAGSLFIEERSTDEVNLWTASDATVNDLETVGDVASAVDNGAVTESNTFAYGDQMVVQISATGLEGQLGVDEDGVVDSDDFSTFLSNSDDLNGSSLWAEQLNPGTNRQASMLNFSAITDDMTVFYDGEGNYYVVADTQAGTGDDLETALEDGSEDSFDDGDQFELTFELQDNRLLDYDIDADGYAGTEDSVTDEYQTLSTEFTVEDRDAEFDVEDVDGDDYVTVNAESGQAITGTTNLAPGTELTVRASGEDDARFVKSQTDVVVQGTAPSALNSTSATAQSMKNSRLLFVAPAWTPTRPLTA